MGPAEPPLVLGPVTRTKPRRRRRSGRSQTGRSAPRCPARETRAKLASGAAWPRRPSGLVPLAGGRAPLPQPALEFAHLPLQVTDKPTIFTPNFRPAALQQPTGRLPGPVGG